LHIEAAKPALKTQLVDFSGELFWNETSEKIYRQADLNEQQYVGAPSVELDKSWDELLGGEFSSSTLVKVVL
jgi:hypothetical protein